MEKKTKKHTFKFSRSLHLESAIECHLQVTLLITGKYPLECCSKQGWLERVTQDHVTSVSRWSPSSMHTPSLWHFNKLHFFYTKNYQFNIQYSKTKSTLTKLEFQLVILKLTLCKWNSISFHVVQPDPGHMHKGQLYVHYQRTFWLVLRRTW